MENKKRQIPENPTNVVEKIMKSFMDACEEAKDSMPVEDMPDIEKSKVKFDGASCQITVPREWLDEMGITEDAPSVVLLFDGDRITAQSPALPLEE